MNFSHGNFYEADYNDKAAIIIITTPMGDGQQLIEIYYCPYVLSDHLLLGIMYSPIEDSENMFAKVEAFLDLESAQAMMQILQRKSEIVAAEIEKEVNDEARQTIDEDHENGLWTGFSNN